MTEIYECKDRSDCTVLYAALGLFLKPIARINITIHYPQLKQTALPAGGKSVSSWELMEKLKALVEPQQFIQIKIVKNTLEFIRFEGDLETRDELKTVMGRLEGKKLKLTVFKESLKILVAETKLPFPSKYDWDSFFRDTKTMNEMKAGERPDTIHFQNIPCKWFADQKAKAAKNPLPSEKLFRRVWDTFGEVRCIDIPVLDPYRSQMNPSFSGIKTFTFNQDPVFEAYVQYKDYMSFVKVMDVLRGMFLMYQEGEKLWVANVKANFDKSKHLTDESIKRRKAERERLIQKERANDMQAHKLMKDVEAEEEADEEKKRTIEHKIALEERRYLVARRKLEAIRVMDYLLELVKVNFEKEQDEKEDSGSGDSERENVKSQQMRKRNKKLAIKKVSIVKRRPAKRESASEDDESVERRRRKQEKENVSEDEEHDNKSDKSQASEGESNKKEKVIKEKDDLGEDEIEYYRRNSAKYYRDKYNTSRVSHQVPNYYSQQLYSSRYHPAPMPFQVFRRPPPIKYYNPRQRYNNYNYQSKYSSSRSRSSSSRNRPERHEEADEYDEREVLNRTYEKYFRSLALKGSKKESKEAEAAGDDDAVEEKKDKSPISS